MTTSKISIVNSQDTIDHPVHYNYGNHEVIDIIQDWGFGEEFCAGNAIKYIARYKHKKNAIEDLKKAIWYLERLVIILEEKQNNDNK